MKRYRNATVAFIVSILLTSCSEHVDANNSMAKYLGLILFSYISYNILLKKFFKSKKIRKYKDAAVHYISWFAVMSSICLFMFGITKMNNKYEHPTILLIISPVLFALACKQLNTKDSEEAENNFKLLTFTIGISLAIIYLYNYFGKISDIFS